jgi:formate dehydrogenase subunit gamma
VDINWAKEHHDLWLEDTLAKERPAGGPGQTPATPAG